MFGARYAVKIDEIAASQIISQSICHTVHAQCSTIALMHCCTGDQLGLRRMGKMECVTTSKLFILLI